MGKWLCTFVLCCLAWRSASADDRLAEQLFDEGVAAAAHKQWQEAAYKLEASLTEADKPSTHFNLALAYRELDRPLELTRHALAFLASEPTAARERARARAHELLSEALPRLAAFDLSEAPQGTSLKLDAATPPVVDGTRHYVLPGRALVELQVGGGTGVHSEWLLSAGQVVRWPELSRIRPLPVVSTSRPAATTPSSTILDAPPPATSPPWRKRAAWTVGTLGAALFVASVASFGVTLKRANELEADGLEGTSQPGHLDRVSRYESSFYAVMPLALTGGALMAGSFPLGPPSSLRGSLGWSISALTLGAALLVAGSYWLIDTPGEVVETTGIERPSRPAGSLLFAAGLPLATYGITFLVLRQRPVRVGVHGGLRAAISW